MANTYAEYLASAAEDAFFFGDRTVLTESEWIAEQAVYASRCAAEENARTSRLGSLGHGSDDTVVWHGSPYKLHDVVDGVAHILPPHADLLDQRVSYIDVARG